MQFRPLLLSCFFVIPLINGCSISASSTSSESSSDSSGSSSDSSSSSTSSSSSEDEKEYEDQIMDYTTAYLSIAEYDRFAFLKGISENGMTNWEGDEITMIGIGRGLRKSGMTGSVYETYKKSIAGSNEFRLLNIQKGYDMQ